jgi:two-component system CheB/CheR fusion protein
MVVDILSYSRVSGREPDGKTDTTDLNSIVRELLEDFEILISERKAKVTVWPLPQVAVSRGSIRQVFQNLISNALKFCRPDTECIIEIGPVAIPEGEELFSDPTLYTAVSVKDNGIGFDPQFSEKIFSLFHRLNTKDKFEGSGIGLAVARKIMDRAGGAIRVSSQEGQGSEFVLILPLRG